jgi:3-oxoacyl-[acyl-carrier protein] reductase
MKMKHQTGCSIDFIVSGASSGIGRSVVDLLLEKEYGVLGLSRTFRSLPQNDNYRHLNIDLETKGSDDSISQFLGNIDNMNLKGVFSNAGSFQPYEHEKFDFDRIYQQLESNLFSHIRLVKSVWKYLHQGDHLKSLVFNTTDQVWRTKNKGAAYAAAKSSLNSYARSLAIYLAESKIVVSTIAPGGTDTKLYWETKKGMIPAELQNSATKYPIRRIGEPRELAQIIVWLLCQPNKLLTGAEIHADGGLHCV